MSDSRNSQINANTENHDNKRQKVDADRAPNATSQAENNTQNFFHIPVFMGHQQLPHGYILAPYSYPMVNNNFYFYPPQQQYTSSHRVQPYTQIINMYVTPPSALISPRAQTSPEVKQSTSINENQNNNVRRTASTTPVTNLFAHPAVNVSEEASLRKTMGLLKIAFEQLIDGYHFTIPTMKECLREVITHFEQSDSVLTDLTTSLSKLFSEIKQDESGSDYVPDNNKACLISLLHTYVDLVSHSKEHTFNNKMEAFFKHLLNSDLKNNTIFSAILQLTLMQINFSKNKTIQFEMKNSSVLNPETLVQQGKAALQINALSRMLTYKEGANIYFEGIIKLISGAQRYHSNNNLDAYNEVLKIFANNLENCADKISMTADESQNSSRHHPMAKVAYLKLAAYLYQVSITMNKNNGEHFRKLLMSPLYVYYTLAETHHTSNKQKYLSIMQNYLIQYNIANLATRSRSKDFRAEVEEYQHYIKAALESDRSYRFNQ